MPDMNNNGAREVRLTPGSLVRLVGDPHRIGSFQAVVRLAGREFGRVQFPGGISNIPLEQIEAVPAASEEPSDFLRSGRFSEPARLRQVLAHIRLTGRLTDVIYSMELTNTDFHPHQFKPVLKILSSPTGNLLIADEVGLGKTIEAGLIWTELRARFDYRRLLVLCPSVLCTKWEAELSSKFGLDARVVTAQETLALAEDRGRMERGFIAICSLQGMRPPAGWDDEREPSYRRASAKLARLLRERADDEPIFDLLVVDEAHHLRNPETQSNHLARLLRPLAQHQVYLSATPVHLKNCDLLSLLNLIDPETFRDERALDGILEANQPLVEAREALLRGKPKREVVEIISRAELHPLLADTKQIGALVEELRSMPDAIPLGERARLAGRLEQTNLLSNTINRTRRRDVQELRVVRRVSAYRAEMSPPERQVYEAITQEVQRHASERGVAPGFLLATPQRLLASCLPAAIDHWRRKAVDVEAEDEDEFSDDESAASAGSDLRPLVARLTKLCANLPAPKTLEAYDTKFQELLAVLDNFLSRDASEKVVIFSGFRPTLRYLGRRLAHAGMSCVTIHGGTADRKTVLSRFESDPELRILLSSEVGSEGIDLQFCATIINYDLPWNPMRVEQRIGRVDRLGQAAEAVTIINLLHRETIDDHIYRRLYERLRLCERALGGFESVLGEEIAKLAPDLLSGGLTTLQIEQRIDQTRQAIENRMKLEEELEGEAAALIAHGDHILRSIHAAHEMHRWIGARDLARYVGEGLSSLFPGSSVRELGRDDLYEVRLTSEARVAYGEWIHRKRLPKGGRIERELGGVSCRFGRPPAGVAQTAAVETITQTHSFVRFVSDCISETDAPKLRPAVAARLALDKVSPGSAASIKRHIYAVVAMLWRFGGLVDQERIAYAGFDIDDGCQIEADLAERLLLSAAESGIIWSGAELHLDCVNLAEHCDAVMTLLTERFVEEGAARKAEQDDRASIQLRTLEQRIGEQRNRLQIIIDSQRREIARGGSRSQSLRRILAANEGRQKRLEDRAAIRRSEIERSRAVSSQSEQLTVAIIAVH